MASGPAAGGDTGAVIPEVVRYSERPGLWNSIGLPDEVWPESPKSV
jgi:hypothetical protein